MKTENADPFAGKAADWDTNPTRVALAEAVVAALRAQLPAGARAANLLYIDGFGRL